MHNLNPRARKKDVGVRAGGERRKALFDRLAQCFRDMTPLCAGTGGFSIILAQLFCDSFGKCRPRGDGSLFKKKKKKKRSQSEGWRHGANAVGFPHKTYSEPGHRTDLRENICFSRGLGEKNGGARF